MIYRTLYINKDNKIITQIDDYEINILMRQLHEKQYPLFNWLDIAKKIKYTINSYGGLFILNCITTRTMRY